MTDQDVAQVKAERDAAQTAARDFAKALNEILNTENPDWWGLATNALARHPEYST